jgi:transcription antitermination factor NusG
MPEVRSRWYALHVRSRHEKNVHAQLEAKHQDVFLPLYSARQRWSDRWKTVLLPLFPGYVFCRFDATRRCHVVATPGVVEIVKTGSELAPVDDDEIAALQLIVRSGVQAKPYPEITKGQRMMIIRGPLNGLAGTVLELRNTLRLAVSVDLLGRSVTVETDRESVIPADDITPVPSITRRSATSSL